MKKTLLIALAVLILLGGGFFAAVPGLVEKGMNLTIHPPPYEASAAARDLHAQLLVADLHADTLMWNRDLLARGARGHVDVPRLLDGNVAVQAFTVVTKTPRNMNIQSNTGDTDNITLLAIAERWPWAALSNLTERALYQAKRLQDAAAASNGTLTLLRTSEDARRFLARRRQTPRIVAGFLGIEGAQALSGEVANLDRLYDAGFRMIGIAHFFDNEMGGSAHGAAKYGLTEKGRALVKRMEERKVFVDLAHASPRTIDDVLAMATRPLIVSHTGVKGTCNNSRNLSDEQLKGIARTGGVIGIGFWDTATCGRDARAIAKAIRYAVNVAGIDHIGLGSDNDGAVEAPFDISGVVQITDALLQEGLSEPEIRKIMGENTIKLLQAYLP